MLPRLYRLLRLLDFAGPPCLVKPGLERAVEAEDREPAFVRHGCNPVCFLAGGWLRTKIEIDRAVGVGDQLVPLVVLAGKRLACLKLGARLRIVEHHGPEILGW